METQRAQVLPWALPAAIVATGAIAVLWLTRPEWHLISENPSYHLGGIDSTAAIVGTVLLVLALLALVLVARTPASRRRTVTLVLLFAAIPLVFLGVNLALELGWFPSPIPG